MSSGFWAHITHACIAIFLASGGPYAGGGLLRVALRAADAGAQINALIHAIGRNSILDITVWVCILGGS